MSLEDNGKGKNISVQVLDAILCHNGEILEKGTPRNDILFKDNTKIRRCFYEKYNLSFDDYGLRPVINIKSNVLFNGTGTIDDPYILAS